MDESEPGRGPRSESKRNRYAEIFELAPIARVITDQFGVVLEANREATKLLGSSWPLVDKPLAMFVAPEDRSQFRQRLLDVAETTSPITWVMWFQPRHTSAFRGELHVVGSEADPGHLHWAISDVTERTAMEEELRLLAAELEIRVQEQTREVEAERARLAAVVDQIPAGLTIIDLEGHVVTANAEARRLLGGDAMQGIEGIPAEGGGRAEVARSDGTRVVLEVNVAPIVDPEGRHAGAVQLFHDISEREQQERAEREFVTNAAHQLQSPLAGILSAIDVLQAGAKQGPERDVFLGHIEQESNRLARLARALLILARAQTGYEAPKDEVVALEPLLTEVAASLRPADGVEVRVTCQAETAVVTNRELVEQALVNVAENAAKYTMSGRIELEGTVADGTVEMVVRDTGPGIPIPEQSLVLDRFYRASANGSDGFGLGFAIVRSAVDALDGRLELESEPGVGTVVSIRLPRAVSLVES
jgi:two-component system, OmpR family, phosphate regulon sensor histidine kinase PhoR